MTCRWSPSCPRLRTNAESRDARSTQAIRLTTLRATQMRMLFAILCGAACATALADELERPRAKQMPQARAKDEASQARARREWQNAIHDRYMNREWLYELADKYEKTGVRPAYKQFPGIIVRFYVASNDEELRQMIFQEATKNSLGVIHKIVRQRGKKLLAVTMWLDEDVVDWPFDGGNWATTGRLDRIDSR